MSNSSVNKVAMTNLVRFTMVASTEKTIVLPENVKFIEIVNDSAVDVYFAVGDRIAGVNTATRLMSSDMASVIVKSFGGQTLQPDSFKEISFYIAAGGDISFMSMSSTSLI